MNTPLVSILIPVFNAEKYIRATLGGISGQTYSNWECILVDDGSTDASADIIQDFIADDSRFQLIIRPNGVKKGANPCRNFAFALAKGEWVNWFDADDVMLPDFISEKITLIDSDVDFVITSGYNADENLATKKPINLYTTTDLYVEYALWKLKILTPSIMFRKSFLDNKKLFDENILKGQEAEFFSRLFYGLTQNNYVIGDAKTFLYRNHNDSSTARNRTYRADYKASEIQHVSRNLSNAIVLKRAIFAESSYRLLINLLHKAIIHRDKQNANQIVLVLSQHLKSKNQLLILALQFVVFLHKAIPIRQFRWDAAFKKLPIRI